tara:strand:- start:2422 stop:4164 length:1743 start_codon:yes stop_codon:yes gene_type:complete
MASELRVNTINSRTGFGTITVSETGQDLVGITTIENLTAENTLVGAAASFTGNVSVGGVLTYEDVTNIDSVGLITARQGIEIGARPGVAASISVDGNMIVSGVSTFAAITATSFGAVSGTTGTFSGDVSIADKIIHTGDTNTAIRFADADTITAETAGSERLRITDGGYVRMGSGGRIGINTAGVNPYTDLHIATRDANLWLGNPLSGFSNNQYPNLKIICDDPNKRAYIDQMYGGDNAYDRNITFGGTYLGLHSPGSSNGAETVRITEEKALFGNYFTAKTIGDTNSAIQIQGTDANTTSLTLFRYSQNDSGPTITLGKGRAANAGEPDKPQDGDSLGQIRWMMANNNDLVNGYAASIKCNVDAEPGGGDTPGRITFWTSPDTSSTMAERMRINNAGDVMINATSSTDGNTSKGLHIYADGGSMASFKRAQSGAGLRFIHVNALAGWIELNSNNTVSYTSSSDYRLKENNVPISDGIARVKNLKPYRFNWKSEPDVTVDGFFAHEAQGVVPESATRSKDRVVTQEDLDTGYVRAPMKVGDPIHQSMDNSKLVPLLTAALQEAIAKIENLESEVAALKSS